MSLWDDTEPPQDRMWVIEPRTLTPEEREDWIRILAANGTRSAYEEEPSQNPSQNPTEEDGKQDRDTALG